MVLMSAGGDAVCGIVCGGIWERGVERPYPGMGEVFASLRRQDSVTTGLRGSWNGLQ